METSVEAVLQSEDYVASRAGHRYMQLLLSGVDNYFKTGVKGAGHPMTHRLSILLRVGF